MKKLATSFLVFFLFLSASMAVSSVEAVDDSSLVKERVEVDAGEGVGWQGFEVSYSSAGRNVLGFTSPEGILLEQFNGEDFYSVFGEIKKFSNDFYFRADKLDRDENYVEATVWAPEEAFGSSEINVTAPEYIVKQSGEEFTVPVEIKNTGGVEEAYELSAESEKLISTDFVYQGYNITKLVVEPGEEKEITAEIDVDEDIGSGMKEINFSVSNRSFSSENFRFQVIDGEESERSLRMDLDQRYVEKSSGESFETRIRVENIGDSIVEDVEPSISAPENWNYTLEPEETENISSNEFQDFELKVSVPSTTTTGDYFIDVGLENTEDFDGENLRANISDSSGGFGLLGLILALTAILLVAGVYKVFGRR